MLLLLLLNYNFPIFHAGCLVSFWQLKLNTRYFLWQSGTHRRDCSRGHTSFILISDSAICLVITRFPFGETDDSGFEDAAAVVGLPLKVVVYFGGAKAIS